MEIGLWVLAKISAHHISFCFLAVPGSGAGSEQFYFNNFMLDYINYREYDDFRESASLIKIDFRIFSKNAALTLPYKSIN